MGKARALRWARLLGARTASEVLGQNLTTYSFVSLPPWQAAVHFRRALAHTQFLHFPSLHLHFLLSEMRRRFFLGSSFTSSSLVRGEGGGATNVVIEGVT